MVPCTLWLLRHQRRTLVAGCLATLAGWGFVAFSLHWLQQQPYSVPEHLFFRVENLGQLGLMAKELIGVLLEIPFLILPIVTAYLILLRGNDCRFWKSFAICGAGYVLVAVGLAVADRPGSVLEPMLGGWVTPLGRYGVAVLGKMEPVVLSHTTRILLTAVSTLSTLCAVAFLWEKRGRIIHDEVDEQQAGVSSLTSRSVS